MMNRFTKLLAILCALILVTSAVSVFAEEAPATPTDLEPEKEQAETILPEEKEPEESLPEEKQEEQPEEKAEENPAEELPEEKPEEKPEDKPEEIPEEKQTEELPEENREEAKSEEQDSREEEGSAVESAEVIITKNIRLGDTWEGFTKDTKPVLLKLDLNNDQTQTIHLLVEGKKVVWATVQKSDRPEETPQMIFSDPETKRLHLAFEAEKGSYLIQIGPEAPTHNTRIAVTIMDDDAFEAWKDQLAEAEAEQQTEPEEENESAEPGIELETEPEAKPTETDEGLDNNKPESGDETEEAVQPENEMTELPSDRDIEITISWDDENPTYGSTAHFNAAFYGYDDLEYTVQWQWTEDNETWTDVPNATEKDMDVVFTKENGSYHWRILVYIIQPTEN